MKDPKSEMAIRGPREGLTESIRMNTAMLRRKIRSPKLWMEQWTIGEISQTPVSIMYIKGLADEDVLKDLRERLEAIRIDGILGSGYIEELINDQRWSPFPTILSNERPLKGVYPILGFPIGEFVFITMLFPLVRKQDRHKLRKSLKLSAVLITFVSILITIFLIGVMGVDEASRSPYAVYDMAKNINIEEILVRVEIFVAMVWIGTVFMKLALCVYVLAVITAQMLNLPTYRMLVVPYASIIVPLSLLMYRNLAHAKVFKAGVWTLYSLFQGFLLPLLLLIIAVIRGIRDNSDGGFPEIKPQGERERQDHEQSDQPGEMPDQDPVQA